MRRLYLDTSALVKRYVVEDGTPNVDSVFEDAIAGNTIIRTSYWNVGEAAGVFDKMERKGKVAFTSAMERFLTEARALRASGNMEFIEISNKLIEDSIAYLAKHHIYISDALQLASFVQSDCEELITADKGLRNVAEKEGLKASLIK